MGASVDEKVVQLTLDNKQFNKASDETIDSLEKLKKTLEFEGAIDSFDEIEKEIKKVDFSPMDKGIQGLSNQFNALNTIADAALRNITNNVIASGERMIKSLSVDQITTGWSKYAEQTGAVQTIMAATAQQFDDTEKQMEAVNEQLDKLTWFTDETSHKFNDMVSGIGKFTANNIDLETSVKAMEGIATWASLSGANANEASRAIYNLSQAVATGSVKLLDWRSIENANMATNEFRNTALKTAEELGTLTRVADNLWATLDGKVTLNAAKGFSDSLQKEWFTADVLLGVLDKYGGYANRLNDFVEETGVLTATAMNIVDDYVEGTLDMQEAMNKTGLSAEDLTKWLEELGSEEYELGRRALRASQETKTFQEAIDYVKEAVSSGWATSFKYIFGDYLEAKEWWSEVAEAMYDVFVVGGEIRNTMLELWSQAGGSQVFLDSIREIMYAIVDFKDFVSDAWGAVFPNDVQTKAAWLLDLTDRFYEFVTSLHLSEEAAASLHEVLKLVFNILKVGKIALNGVVRILKPLVNLLNNVLGVALQLAGELAGEINNALDSIFESRSYEAVINALTTITTIISNLGTGTLRILVDLIHSIFGEIGAFYDRWKAVGGGLSGLFIVVKDSLVAFYEQLMNGETFVNKFVNTVLGIFGILVEGVKLAFKTLAGVADDATLGGGFTKWFGKVGEVIEKLNLSEKFQKIAEFAKDAVGWLTQLITDLFVADSSIRQLLSTIGGELQTLYNWIKDLFGQVDIDDVKDLLLITILWQYVGSLNALNKSFSGLIKGFSTTVGNVNKVMNNLLGNFTVLDKINTLATQTKILQIAVAALLLVKALDTFNQLDYKRTLDSLIMITAALSALVLVFKKFAEVQKSMPKIEKKKEGNLAASLLAIAAGVFMIAEAAKRLSEAFVGQDGIQWDKLLTGLGSVALILASIAGVAYLFEKFDIRKLTGLAGTIIALATAINIITHALVLMSKVDSEVIGSYILQFSALVLALGGAIALLGKTNWQSILSAVPAVLAITSAVIALTGAITGVAALIGMLEEGTLLASVGVFSAALLGLVSAIVAVNLASKKANPTAILATAAALTSLGFAVIEIAGAFLMLGKVDWENVNKGLGWIIGTMGTLIVLTGLVAFFDTKFNYKLSKSIDRVAGAFMKFGATLALIGVAFLTISTSVSIFMAAVTGLGILTDKLKEKGIDIQEAIHTGFDTLKIFINEFIDFLLSLSGRLVEVFLMIYAAVRTAMAIKKNQLILDIIAFGVTLMEALKTWGDPLFDALLGVMEVLNRRFPELKTEIDKFAEMLGEALVSAILNAIKGAIKGALGWLGDLIGLDEWFEDVEAGMTQHIDGMGDAVVDSLIKQWDKADETQKRMIERQLEDMIAGYESGQSQMSDTAYQMAVDFMKEYDRGARDEAGMHSPADMTIKQGEDLVDGYRVAVDKEKDALRNTGAAAVDSVYDGAEETLEKRGGDFKGKAVNAATETGTVTGESAVNALSAGAEATKDTAKATFASVGAEAGAAFLAPIKAQASAFFDSIFGGFAGTGDTTGLFDFGGSKVSSFKEEVTNIRNLSETLGDSVYGIVMSMDTVSIEAVNRLLGVGDITNEEYQAIVKNFGLINKELDDATEEAKSDGNTVVDSFGDAIGSSSAGARGAKTQVDKISDTFKSEISKIDFTEEGAELNYKLWQAMNPDASEAEKLKMEAQYTADQLKYQGDRMAAAESYYNDMVKQYGETSEEAMKAEHEFLQHQIKYYELQNKLAETRQGSVENTEQAFRAASAWMNERGEDGLSNYEFLIKQGFKPEDIYRNALEQQGLNAENYIAKKTADTIKNGVTQGFANEPQLPPEETSSLSDYISNTAVAAIEEATPDITNASAALGEQTAGVVIEQTTEGLNFGLGTLGATSSQKAKEIGTNVGQGVADGEESKKRTINNMSTGIIKEDVIGAMEDEAETHSPSKKTYYIGQMLGEGLAQGFESMRTRVLGAVIKIIQECLLLAKQAAGTHSPSRETEWIGQMMDLGLVKGMDGYANKVYVSATGMMDNLNKTMHSELANQTEETNRYLKDAFGLDDNELSMRVVVDLDDKDARNKMSELERLYSARAAGSMYGSVAPTSGINQNRSGLLLQSIEQEERYRADTLQNLYNLVDSYFTESKMQSATPTVTQQQASEPANISFTQNNYSPKTIGRVETYRNTKRQFTAFANKLQSAKR